MQNQKAAAYYPDVPVPTQRETAANEISVRLAKLNDEAARLLDRLSGVNSRAFGPAPVATGEKGTALTPSGALQNIGAQFEILHRVVGLCHEAAERIESIV